MKKVNLKPKESGAEKYLVKEIKKLGGKAYKFTSPANNAVPDRLIVLKGFPITFVEMKDVGKGPRPLQASEITFLRSQGAQVYVVRGKEEAIQFINLVKESVHND